MNTPAHNTFALTAIAAAMLAAYGPATAAEVDEVTELSRPESTVSAGFGYVSQDNQRFGQYTGMDENGGYGLLDLNLVRRDDSTGTWVTLEGRNLGLEDRELRFEHRRQGDWGYFVDLNQTPRYSPYMVNTRLSGIGTANQAVGGESARDVQLKTERTIATLGADKVLPAGFDFQVRFRNEEKTGSRLFGRTGPDFLAEPIDSNTRGIEATLGYTGKQLQLSGGYYASHYDNRNPALDVTGGAGTYTPIALPPDNESHQLYLSGGYSFTPTTRGTFKLAYARATQDDSFIPAPIATPNLTGQSQLDGRLDTTQVQFGLTSRPVPKLSLLANFRYEDRDDKTPIVRYISSTTGTNTFDGLYEPRSIKTKAGKLEAGYQLPRGFHVTGGVDYDLKERYVPNWAGGSLASVTTRAETEETTYRLQLRRSLSETINGALSYVHSNRGGSDLLTNTTLNGGVGSNAVAPLHLADRERDKWRLLADWAAAESLSFQFAVEDVKDDYSGRTYGPRSGSAQNYSMDAAYTLSDNWQATAWLSRNETDSDQTLQTSAGQPWAAALGNTGDSLGIGVRGKLKGLKQVGADLQYTSDHGSYDVTSPSAIPGTVTLPPDSHYRVTRLKLFADYALQKNAGVRINYAYERWTIDDWTWASTFYADGTRVFQDSTQTVHFLGASVYYRWW
jgi:MtrB/PioB family decaheme-associated outer membrane protein